MRRTRKFQRTFYEDDEISIPVNWIDNIICAYTYNYEPRDPAEFETRLSNKVKITIEIFNTNEDDTQGNILQAVADDRISQSCASEIMNEFDAILSLPLDVPSDKEIKAWALSCQHESQSYRLGKYDGATRMRDEILKRNGIQESEEK